jgi:glutaminase
MISPIEAHLAKLHARYVDLDEGDVARYIPELANADPRWFGIAVATTDGHVYEVGDTRQPFTIQSISKALAYGLALEDRGEAAVMRKIGVEPSGDAFNSISLSPATGRPLNPMINAGAIAATAQIAGSSAADKLERMLAVFSLYAGRTLAIDETVYESERATGHRNRAIGHMLRNFDVLESDPEIALDQYFRQCSILVDCRDLAVMAGTLANGGLNPVTDDRAIRSDLVDKVLSVMTTCGMYDFAGEWTYAVGLPAKSGVGGGILAVLPGQLGIAVFSPRLDARGNSVRGVAVCRDLSKDLDLHFLRVPRASRAATRGEYSIAELSSKKRRSEGERRILDREGVRARVWELQGDLTVPALEPTLRQIAAAADATRIFVVDLRRVSLVGAPATGLLLTLLLDVAGADGTLVLSGVGAHAKLVRTLQERLAERASPEHLRVFLELDRAIEWCEERLLGHADRQVRAHPIVPLAEHALCRGLRREEVERLGRLGETRSFARGELIVREGEPADGLYLLMRGEVSVTIDLPSGQQRRLATLSGGMAFGELALLDHAPRTADVRADSDVDCVALSVADLDRLGAEHPRIKLTILENLLRNVYGMVSRLNVELASLAR